MAGVFERGIVVLERLGIADVLLPFLLVFTIVFAVLQKTNIFGENKRNFNTIIALVMGLAVIIPHALNSYPPGWDVVDIINRALPNVSLIAIAIVMLLLLVGLVQPTWMGSSFAGLLALIAFIATIWIFYAAAYPGTGVASSLPGWLQDPDTQALIIIIAVFGIVIWFITKEPTHQQAPGFRMGEWLRDFFGGGHR